MVYKSMLNAKSYYIPIKNNNNISKENKEYSEIKNVIKITPFEIKKDFNLGNTFKLSNLDNLINNY